MCINLLILSTPLLSITALHLFISSSGIVLAIITFLWRIDVARTKKIDAKFDNKADKKDLEALLKNNKEDHEKFIQRAEFNMLMETMNNHNGQLIIIQNDIKEILKRSPKK